MRYCLLSLLFQPLFWIAGPTFAADINLTVHQKSIDDRGSITVENNSTQAVAIDSVDIELDQQNYKKPFTETIPPDQSKILQFKVTVPVLPGSYPLIVTVRYLNNDKILSLRHVGIFNFQEQAPLNTSCIAENTSLDKEGDIILGALQPQLWKLVLPEEMEVVSVATLSDRRIFHIKNNVTGFKSNYPYFAVAEDVLRGKHRTAYCSGSLSTGSANAVFTNRGRISSEALVILSVIFFGAASFMIQRKKSETRASKAFIKYASRMLLITVSYYMLKNIDSWLDCSLTYIDWRPYRHLAAITMDNFRGQNYNYFFRHFVDIYLGACLIFGFPYFYYRDLKKSPENDKYVSLIKGLFSLPGAFARRGIYWNHHAKLGLLTVGVKLFYIPYLTSWVINNTIHQYNLTSSFQWDFYAVNSYLLALFIYIDTIVFAFGYVIESGYLKSEIKTVEPTILGWVVCLWCYPPFNAFSFKIFDYQLIDITHTYPACVHALTTGFVTALWGAFAWASLALGFKASNLTNRGIVMSGPYRFVRHPAYAAKLIVWLIQGIFFGQYGIGILFGFILIYALRAWTEERHLSKDPEYVKYKQLVPWSFIPRVL